MLRIKLLAAISAAVVFSPLVCSAQFLSDDPRWSVLSPSERVIIDRVAADFYEAQLRQQQAVAIERQTSERYRSAADRTQFRDERRAAYQDMTPAQRDALRGVKRPAFRHLSEEQKAPFRAYALDQLTAAGAVDQQAIEQAWANEV